MEDPRQNKLDLHAVEAHIILVESSLEGEVDQNQDYVLGYTGTALPTYNFFIPLTLTGLTDDTLADASAFFRTRDTPYAVSLEEHRVQDGTEYLSKRRYQPLPPQPIMSTESLPTQLKKPEALSIERVNTVPGLTALYTVLGSIFDYTTDELSMLIPTKKLADSRIDHFVGFVDERPVTAGTAIYSHNVVSVWNLSTLDDYRRKGYGSAMLNHILVHAVNDKACTASLIYGTPMSFSLLNNFGYNLYAMRQWFLPQEVS